MISSTPTTTNPPTTDNLVGRVLIVCLLVVLTVAVAYVFVRGRLVVAALFGAIVMGEALRCSRWR